MAFSGVQENVRRPVFPRIFCDGASTLLGAKHGKRASTDIYGEILRDYATTATRNTANAAGDLTMGKLIPAVLILCLLVALPASAHPKTPPAGAIAWFTQFFADLTAFLSFESGGTDQNPAETTMDDPEGGPYTAPGG